MKRTTIGGLLPDRAMGNATQIGLIIVGLKFLIFPNTRTKEQMAQQSTGHSRKTNTTD